MKGEKTEKEGIEGIAQSGKCLHCKHKDLTWVPQIPVWEGKKQNKVSHACNPGAGKCEQADPWGPAA